VAAMGDVCGMGDGTALVGDVALRCVDAQEPSASPASTNHVLCVAAEWRVMVLTTVTCAG
jgi:hypothetical protein